SIAAAAYNHVYILYPQYGTMPGCANCAIPTLTLVVSNDNGTTFQPPRAITPPGTGQFDPQIAVDPNDRRTVYAAWLQDNKTDVAVAKSTDFGQSWSVVLAANLDDIDTPTLAVRGSDVIELGRKNDRPALPEVGRFSDGHVSLVVLQP